MRNFATYEGLFPPPLRARVREGGKRQARHVRFTPLPTGCWPVDRPRKGGGEGCGKWSGR
jgi:hypothetical protein